MIEKANIILKGKDSAVQNTDLMQDDSDIGGREKTQTMNFLRKGQGSVTKSDNSELKPSIIEPEMLARAHV